MNELNEQYKRIHQQLIALEQLELSHKKSQANDRKQLLATLQIVFGMQLTMASLFPSFLIDDSEIRVMQNYSQLKAVIQSYNPPSYVAILFFLFLAVKQWYKQPRYHFFQQSKSVCEGALIRYAVSCQIFFLKNHLVLTYQLLIGLQKNTVIIEMNAIGKLLMMLYLMLINRVYYELYNFCTEHLKSQKLRDKIENNKEFYIKLLQDNARMKRSTNFQTKNSYQSLYRLKQKKEQIINQCVNRRAAVIDSLLLRIQNRVKQEKLQNKFQI